MLSPLGRCVTEMNRRTHSSQALPLSLVKPNWGFVTHWVEPGCLLLTSGPWGTTLGSSQFCSTPWCISSGCPFPSLQHTRPQLAWVLIAFSSCIWALVLWMHSWTSRQNSLTFSQDLLLTRCGTVRSLVSVWSVCFVPQDFLPTATSVCLALLLDAARVSTRCVLLVKDLMSD